MAAKSKSEPAAAENAKAGSKHKTEPQDDSAPISKRTRASKNKDQAHADHSSGPSADTAETKTAQHGVTQVKTEKDEAVGGSPSPSRRSKPRAGSSGGEKKKASPRKTKTAPGRRPGSTASARGRDSSAPPTLLEKGIIYFFFRGRVREKTGGDGAGGDEEVPRSVDDVARSHIVLRPVEPDASLRDLGDAGKRARLLALPKKFLPRTGRDRFMTMVEKGATDFATLRDTFLRASDHETKTRGTRHAPAAAPLAEGVYAVTSTGRNTHLAYILTLPQELGEVQRAMGLKERGSFIVNTKNSKNEGPPNARFAQKPEYPDEIMEEFGSYRWLPLQPKHLDYPNTQLLLIGESSGLEKATKKEGDDGVKGEEEPLEELEKLEDEDLERMQHLAADQSAAIFADLQVRADDYPKLKTTF